MLWWDPSKTNKLPGGTLISVMVRQLWWNENRCYCGPSRCYDGLKLVLWLGQRCYGGGGPE